MKKINSKTKTFFLDDLNFVVNHAGYKARLDILKVVKLIDGINIIKLPLWGGALHKIKIFPRVIFSMLFLLPNKSKIILQFPYPKPYLDLIILLCNLKGIKVDFIVHDIDVFRGEGNLKQIKQLNSANKLIIHNAKMKDVLLNKKVSTQMESIDIFDYFVDNDNLFKEHLKNSLREESKIINIFYCGNLSKEKSNFIYEWNTSDKINRYVYGIRSTEKIKERNTFMGAFQSNSPPIVELDGMNFGLVWDGDDFSTCSGGYGEYLRYNNPHKTSLYITMGLPIITWSESAISDFIINEKLGFVVTSLSYLENILEEVSYNDYNILKNNVLNIREKIISGYYAKKSIKELMVS